MPSSLLPHIADKVTFIREDGAFEVRMINTLPDTINSAAESLDARFVVAAFDWDSQEDVPVWGVYDMSKATRVPGGKSLPFPLNTFRAATCDAAVMYAIAKMGG
jgi:hypothetical protein